jgi:sporulation protein YabP
VEGGDKMDEKITGSNVHNIMMQDRERVALTGVLDVFAFDDENVDIETEMGMLTIKGIDLHINKLNLDKKELEVDGQIESLVYHDRDSFSKGGKSFLSKLFK